MSFALKLKEQREKKGLSQSALAKVLGVSIGCVGMWESTDRIPPAKKLITIANFFNVSSDYLLGRSDDAGIYTPYQNHNSREEELLSMFRQMNTAQQNRFLGIAEGMIEESAKSAKT